MSSRSKVCFAASSGGHFEQLMMLRPLITKYDSFIVTEHTDYNSVAEGDRVYYLKQVNRDEWNVLILMLINTLRSLRIILKEKPDFIVTTGVLAMIPLTLLGKLFGSKLIYIESFAKVKTPTKTGKLLYNFSDQFFVQWRSMLKVYPDAIYLGAIY